MSDYMFMLESHLTPAQRSVVAAVESAAAGTEDQIFLVGGAMRDMLGGFPIGDLDFVVQGNAMALANAVVRQASATITARDNRRKSVEMVFPNGVTAGIGMTRTESYRKPGAQPKVTPAAIHEDLIRRDFTINSIGLSLHRAARGLLLDPTNGLGDLERRELRSANNYGFYNDPVRLLRLVRFRVRFGFQVHERTQSQYENAREAGVEKRIPRRALFGELRATADEASVGQIMAELEREKLTSLFSPALEGAKLNLGVLSKLEKARQMIPYGANFNLNNLGLFFYFLTEKLTPSEKSALIKRLAMEQAEVDLWQQLEHRSRKLEKDLRSSALRRPSRMFLRLREAPGEEILFLYLHTKERLVHDRIRNYLQKYLYTTMEVNDREVASLAGVDDLSDPRLPVWKEEIILARLDGRKWKSPVPPKPSRKKRAGKKTAATKVVTKNAAGRAPASAATGKSVSNARRGGASG